jgi:hypothetical protein
MKTRILVCLFALAIALPAAAQTPDITGTWTVNATLDSGALPPSKLTLNHDGTKIVGTLSGQQGDMRVEASLKANAVTIWFTVPSESGPTAITMNGTLAGDVIKGSADLGGTGKATWTANRSGAGTSGAAPATDGRIDVSGTWIMAVETGAGSGTPTVLLKQDGEKLTGQYSGQLGEAPVTGTAKGSAVEFGFDISVQGTPFHVTYVGTADPTSMKGAVKLGDLGEGTFTGKKK